MNEAIINESKLINELKTVPMNEKTPFKFYIGCICHMHWGWNTTRNSFYVVTRLSDHYVWFKEIPSQKLNTEYSKAWGFQKGYECPLVRVIDKKVIPIETHGGEFRLKRNTWGDDHQFKNDIGKEYCYMKHHGLIDGWDGKIKEYDHMD